MQKIQKLIWLPAAALLAACAVQVQPGPSTGLKWYSTCGDPVCGRPNQEPVPNTCGNRVEGQVCSVAGESCDLGNDCNQKLVCASSDPKQQPGGCPISKAVYKQDIHYIGAQERGQLARQLQDLRLASWQYRFEPQGPTRLGFMIDGDTPPSLVKPDGNSVDLYGYMSLAVAAVQEQQDRIQGLEARLLRLEQALEACGDTSPQPKQ